MVGDSYADDIEGARALGIRAILLDRDGLQEDESDRIDTLLALPAALGLAASLVTLCCKAVTPRAQGCGGGASSSAARQASVCAPSGTSGSGVRPGPEVGVRLGERRNRPDTDLLAVEQREPVRQRAAREEAGELRAQRSLGGLVLPRRELRRAEQLAGAAEEGRLERGERQVAAVGGRVRLVAGEAAGEQPRKRVAAEAVRDELVGAVGHRDDEPRAFAGARAPDERREHLGDRP